MKKVIVLVGLFISMAASAGTFQKTAVTELVPIQNMYAAFELVTPKYDQVLLDCQSFVNGLSFYKNKLKVHEVKMVNYSDCGEVYNFINQSLTDKEPVCLQLEDGKNAVSLSNDGPTDCQ
jgi:hypothetical protein